MYVTPHGLALVKKGESYCHLKVSSKNSILLFEFFGRQEYVNIKGKCSNKTSAHSYVRLIETKYRKNSSKMENVSSICGYTSFLRMNRFGRMSRNENKYLPLYASKVKIHFVFYLISYKVQLILLVENFTNCKKYPSDKYCTKINVLLFHLFKYTGYCVIDYVIHF